MHDTPAAMPQPIAATIGLSRWSSWWPVPAGAAPQPAPCRPVRLPWRRDRIRRHDRGRAEWELFEQTAVRGQVARYNIAVVVDVC